MRRQPEHDSDALKLIKRAMSSGASKAGPGPVNITDNIAHAAGVGKEWTPALSLSKPSMGKQEQGPSTTPHVARPATICLSPRDGWGSHPGTSVTYTVANGAKRLVSENELYLDVSGDTRRVYVASIMSLHLS
jgi:hypothetical protein